MDLTTPQNRAAAKQWFQQQMSRDLSAAIRIWKSMRSETHGEFLTTVLLFNRIRSEIEARAVELGISKACKTSIPDCRGDCCRWHFPKDLTVTDFLIAVCRMPAPETTRILRILRDSEATRFQCPLLQSNGCSFSFEQRPFACTVAFPCHAGESYHRFTTEKRNEIDGIRARLEKMIAETR